ncbi:MAG TPA: hypothetical protein DEB28_04395 [Hyphomonas sp.]|nr:hypothetical protein [Hyphomonas sp.]MAX82993.1 hypothetical protein [Hyphomonas sp.]HAW54863.1 hypothetical protein [Hyphomonas sp.]HBJ42629.1 hypothetical protein [Hyphomonas sp.]HBN91744.1 hypothetical protein [Hyphomonas sp.]
MRGECSKTHGKAPKHCFGAFFAIRSIREVIRGRNEQILGTAETSCGNQQKKTCSVPRAFHVTAGEGSGLIQKGKLPAAHFGPFGRSGMLP